MPKFKPSRAQRLARCAGALVLASILAVGVGVVADPPPAVAQAHDQWGLTDRDWLMKGGGELRAAVGFPGAFPRVLAAAQAGDAKAAALLAGAYAVGAGVAVDQAEGFRWAKVASDKGLPFGHFALALKYRDGTGAAKDMARYIELARKAAAGGHVAAKYELSTGIVPSAEVRGSAPIWSERRAWLGEAAAAGHPTAARYLEAMEANIRFSDALTSKPMWKDGGGLVVGHVEYAMPDHPCATLVRTTQGQMWAIPWNAVKVYRPQATSFVVEGQINIGNPYYTPMGTTVVPLTPLLGFVLLENNRSYTPEKTREIFAQLERDANDLFALGRT